MNPDEIKSKAEEFITLVNTKVQESAELDITRAQYEEMQRDLVKKQGELRKRENRLLSDQKSVKMEREYLAKTNAEVSRIKDELNNREIVIKEQEEALTLKQKEVNTLKIKVDSRISDMSFLIKKEQKLFDKDLKLQQREEIIAQDKKADADRKVLLDARERVILETEERLQRLAEQSKIGL